MNARSHRLALHGLPTHPGLWARVPLELDAPELHGTLSEQVAAVVPRIRPETTLIGHDMGGVVAAEAALLAADRGVVARRVVLCGTALGPYWAAVRASAWPFVWRYFYARHGGRHFVAGAVAPERREEALRLFPGADPTGMRNIARSMRPRPGLAQELAARVPVGLIWGRQDRWYPAPVAYALARAVGSRILWVDGGHFVMWESPEAWAAALCRAVDEPGVQG